MPLLPVIERELRTSARQPATYWIRVLGVLSLFGVLLLTAGIGEPIGSQVGGSLFGALHGMLLASIWMLVPLLTADCISKERREGTLPLLFLTPLKPSHIVYAKGAAHGLRALTIWLAVMPLLAIPLLVGGVGPVEILLSALINCTSVCLALAAGILASALTRVWSRALALSMCLAFIFALTLMCVAPLLLFLLSNLRPRGFWYYRSDFWIGFMAVANAGGVWQEWVSVLRGRTWTLICPYLVAAVGSMLVLLLVITFAAWCVKRLWRGEPPSARVQALQKTLTRPVFFQPMLRRWLRWQLQRNPIGWLEQRSWSSRLVIWSWFAIVVCVYSSMLTNFSLWHRAFHSMQSVLASLLAGSIAVSAAGSFRRERETGVLELLLVAPIQEWQLIKGRLRGLWTQFLPAVILLCAVWLYCATFLTSQGAVSSVFVYCVAFLTLPPIGLYFSLAKSNFMASLLWTLLVGVAVPAFAGQLIVLWLDAENSRLLQNFSAPFVQVLLACLLAMRLHYNLKYRKFSLELKSA